MSPFLTASEKCVQELVMKLGPECDTGTQFVTKCKTLGMFFESYFEEFHKEFNCLEAIRSKLVESTLFG